MKTQLLKQVIEEFAKKKLRVLIISCEGKFTFSNSGVIKSFDDKYLKLETTNSTELIKIENIIKIKLEDQK